MSTPYDSAHQAIRKAMLAVATPATPCARCGRPIGPDPSKIDLGHTDDRTAYSGLECARCNRSAGGKLGNARKRERQRQTPGLEEVAVALEISQDRQHASLVLAGHLPGDLILLDLRYLDYTDSDGIVGEVQSLRGTREVLAVVVDPHAPAATAIGPLEAARVTVTKPTSGDLTVAHGSFIDALRAGRIRHQGQAALTSAMRALEQRRLGGAVAPERRGATVDPSPAVASVLACWGLESAPKPPEPFFAVEAK